MMEFRVSPTEALIPGIHGERAQDHLKPLIEQVQDHSAPAAFP